MFPSCPTLATLRCRSVSPLFCAGNSVGGFSTDWLADRVHCVSPQTIFPAELRAGLCYRLLGEAAASVSQHWCRHGDLTRGGVHSVCQWYVKQHAVILLGICLSRYVIIYQVIIIWGISNWPEEFEHLYNRALHLVVYSKKKKKRNLELIFLPVYMFYIHLFRYCSVLLYYENLVQ